jgi:L-fuconate dehydratase
MTEDLGGFWSSLVDDGQLRWVGPEKGVIHMATAALVNAVWDLYAKTEGKPLWRLLAEMTPEEVVRCIPFRYITDALTPHEALEILRGKALGRAGRERLVVSRGIPAYTTSIGWLGYSDEKIRRMCRTALADGWQHFKLKVGRDLDEDVRRAGVPTRCGMSTRPSPGCRTWPRSTPDGSKSRPAPTTSSDTLESPVRWSRSGSAWPPASIVTTV